MNNDRECSANHSPATHQPASSAKPEADSSRRLFLQRAIGGTLASLAGVAGMELATGPSSKAQSKVTPDVALQTLLDGNRRFMDEKLNSFAEDLAILKQNTIDKQEPFAAVLACADSRVPVELIFDQSIGHVFVTRVAGNVATPEIIASLEYGVAVLGTKVIIVLAHSNCGAIKATISAKEVPGQISALYPHIQPAVDLAGSNVEAVSRANARLQAALLRQASTVIAAALKEGKLKVVSGYYDVGTGAVTLLE
jgi:carbonic anhydrase